MKKGKIVRFKISGEQWEVPLPTLVLVLLITLALMLGGAWMGFQFGQGQL